MRLNHECVRQIMLTIESDISYNDSLGKEKLLEHPKLQSFTEDEILYAVLRLDEADFIKCDIAPGDDSLIYHLSLNGLTWSGHEFLDNIRDNKVWAFVKQTASKTASASLPILAQLAATKMWQYVTTGVLI